MNSSRRSCRRSSATRSKGEVLDPGEPGQASVEFVLVLPLTAFLLAALVQAGLLMVDRMLVASAAREGAREAAVSADAGRVEAAASRAAPGRRIQVRVRWGRTEGDPVTVTVRMAPTLVPFVGAAVRGVDLEASATMRMEMERAEGAPAR